MGTGCDQSSVESWLVQPIKELSSAEGRFAYIRQLANTIRYKKFNINVHQNVRLLKVVIRNQTYNHILIIRYCKRVIRANVNSRSLGLFVIARPSSENGSADGIPHVIISDRHRTFCIHNRFDTETFQFKFCGAKHSIISVSYFQSNGLRTKYPSCY